MSTPAQAGDFGFALQAAKVGKGGTFTSGDYVWYRSEALSVRMDLIQGDQILPPEVGPIIVPKGAFKDSRYGAGQVDMIPRAELGLGILLFGAMGAVSSVTGVDPDGNSVAGVNTHTFRFASNAYTIPWMALRRMIPGATTSDNLGDSFYDAKMTNLRLTVGARGKVSTRVTAIGRDIKQEVNPTWTWDHDYEDATATLESGAGFIKIAGTEYPVTAAVVEWDNGVSTPNQEMTIGDYSPDDFIPLYRTLSIRFVYKWKDSALYRLLRNGGSGTNWTNLPYLFQTVGNSYALELAVKTPKKITGSTPFDLRIRGNNLTIGIDGPIELAGGQLLQQAFTATVLYRTGYDYADFVLANAQPNSAYNFSYTIQ